MPTHSADVLRHFAPSVPDALIARVEAWGRGSEPVAAQPAASVILLREAGDGQTGSELRGLETYLLHRHARMAFAPSMAVFPGGRMDPVDRAVADPWRACAVRETREETGVELTPGKLMPWAEWTTPEFEPRRYETRFYVAALPEGQEAVDVSGETDRADWVTPAEALVGAGAGTLALMPPTQSILLELADLGSLAAVIVAAQGRTVVSILPELVRHGDGWRFVYPTAEERG